MKRIILAIVLCLIALPAAAQCNGSFPANTACGTTTAGPPKPVPFTTITSGLGLVNGQTAITKGTSGYFLANFSNILSQYSPSQVGPLIGAALTSNNLSDLTSGGLARSNLSLGALAVESTVVVPSQLPFGTNSIQGALGCDGTTTTCSGGKVTVITSGAITNNTTSILNNDTVPVFIFFGESGSRGEGSNASATAAELAINPQVQIFNPDINDFESLHIGAAGINNEPWGNGIGEHGWELEFSDLAAQGYFFNKEIYLLKVGQGGTWVNDWSNTQLFIWQQARQDILTGLAKIRAQGKVPFIIGFMSLGENDTINYFPSGQGVPGGYTNQAWSQLPSNVAAIMQKSIFPNLWGLVGAPFPILIDTLRPSYFATKTALQAMSNQTPNTFIIDADADGANNNLQDANHLNYTGLKIWAQSAAQVAVGIMGNTYASPQLNRVPWDTPPNRSPMTITSNSDYTLTNRGDEGGQYYPALGTIGLNTGKAYFEVVNTTQFGTTDATFGIASRFMEVGGLFQGALGNRIYGIPTSAMGELGVTAPGCAGMTVGTTLANAPPTTAGSYLKVAVDFGTGKVWFGDSINGWNGDPVAETSPACTFTPGSTLFYPAGSTFNFNVKIITLHGEAGNIQAAPPSGYSPWASLYVPALPANLVQPFLYGTPTIGSNLNCYPGVWDGISPIFYTYQWSRAGLPISGATERFHTVIASDIGNIITCTLTARIPQLGITTLTTSAITPFSNTTSAAMDPGSAAPGIVFSNNNLTVGGNLYTTYGNAWVRGTDGRSTGKWTYEFFINGGGAQNLFFGMSDDSQTSPTLQTTAPFQAAYFNTVQGGSNSPSGGTVALFTAITTAALPTTNTSNVIDISVDMGTGLGWIAINGTYVSGNPVSETVPMFTFTTSPSFPLFPLIGLATTNAKVTRIISAATHLISGYLLAN